MGYSPDNWVAENGVGEMTSFENKLAFSLNSRSPQQVPLVRNPYAIGRRVFSAN
jgi:hypothetical protein